MMLTYQHLNGLLFNKPHLVHPDKVPGILDSLAGKTGIACDDAMRTAAEARLEKLPTGVRRSIAGPAKTQQRPNGPAPTPYYRKDGLAIIKVCGTLVNRGAWLGAYSGLTSYEGLRFQLRHALEDQDTLAVVLDIDSCGGAGCRRVRDGGFGARSRSRKAGGSGDR